MNIFDAQQLHAGGPGSGRHPEAGSFHQSGVASKQGKGKMTTHFSPKGDRVQVWVGKDRGVVYHHPAADQYDTLGTKNNTVHEGTPASAKAFAEHTYGIRS